MQPTADRRFVLHIFDDFFCITKYGASKCLKIGRDVSPTDSDSNQALSFSIEDTTDIPVGSGRFLSFYAIFGIYWLYKGMFIDHFYGSEFSYWIPKALIWLW